MPDRLPSLIVLVGFWIPPAVAGWVVAGAVQQTIGGARAVRSYVAMAVCVLAYVALWFLFNLSAMPPYIPGSTNDPTYAPPKAVAGLAVVTAALILPGSALACALAFRRRARMLDASGFSKPSQTPF